MKKTSFFLLITVFFTILPKAPAQDTSQVQALEIEEARLDALEDVERNVSRDAWGAIGFFCGCFGVAYAFVATPSVPVGALLGKSPTYVQIYTLVYQEHAKRKRWQSSAVGCGIGAAAGLALNALLTLSASR